MVEGGQIYAFYTTVYSQLFGLQAHFWALDVTLRHSHAPQRIPVKNDPFPGFKLTGGTSYTSEITVTGNLG